MAQLYFEIDADYQKLEKLQQDIAKLKQQASNFSGTRDEYTRLIGTLHGLEGQYARMGAAAAASGLKAREMAGYVNAQTMAASEGVSRFSDKFLRMASVFGIGAMGLEQFASRVMNVTGGFQQIEMAFTTMLQSKQKANDLMAQMVQTAATTPFQLSDVAGGAQQLLAYGTDVKEVNDILVRLGDIAAGTSQPLSQLTYLFGTTMTQGRMFTMDLRQFQGRGIPLAKELAKVMGITEQEVGDAVSKGKVTADIFKQAIISMTNVGGKYGGMMKQQSQTITGMMSNLEDNIDMMFNEIGEKTNGFWTDMLEGAAWVVEHYKQVGSAIAGLAAGIGVWKAIAAATAMADSKVEAYNASVEALAKARSLASGVQEVEDVGGDVVDTANTAAEQANTMAKDANTVAQETNTVARNANTASKEGNTLAGEGNTAAVAGNTVAQEANAVATTASGAATAGFGMRLLTATGLTKLFQVALLSVKTAYNNLKVAMMTNPFGLLLSIVPMVIGLFGALKDNEEDAAEMSTRFGEAGDKAAKDVNTLYGVVNSANHDTKLYKDSIEELTKKVEDYGINIDDEKDRLQQLNDVRDLVIAKIKEEAAEREKANAVQTATETYQKNIDDALKSFGKSLSKNITGGNEIASAFRNLIPEEPIREMARLKGMYEDGRISAQEYTEDLQTYYSDFNNALREYLKNCGIADDKTHNLGGAFNELFYSLVDGKLAFDRSSDAINRASEATARAAANASLASLKTDGLANNLGFASDIALKCSGKVQDLANEIASLMGNYSDNYIEFTIGFQAQVDPATMQLLDAMGDNALADYARQAMKNATHLRELNKTAKLAGLGDDYWYTADSRGNHVHADEWAQRAGAATSIINKRAKDKEDSQKKKDDEAAKKADDKKKKEEDERQRALEKQRREAQKREDKAYEKRENDLDDQYGEGYEKRYKASVEYEKRISDARIEAMREGGKKERTTMKKQHADELQELKDSYRQRALERIKEAKEEFDKAEDEKQEKARDNGGDYKKRHFYESEEYKGMVDKDNAPKLDAKEQEEYNKELELLQAKHDKEVTDSREKELDELQDFFDERLKIDKDFADKQAKLREKVDAGVLAQSDFDTLNEQLKQERDKQLQKAAFEGFQSSPMYQLAMSDGAVDFSVIEKVKEQMEQQLQAAASSLSPSDFKAFSDAYEQLGDKMIEKDPFTPLLKSTDELAKAEKAVTEAHKETMAVYGDYGLDEFGQGGQLESTRQEIASGEDEENRLKEEIATMQDEGASTGALTEKQEQLKAVQEALTNAKVRYTAITQRVKSAQDKETNAVVKAQNAKKKQQTATTKAIEITKQWGEAIASTAGMFSKPVSDAISSVVNLATGTLQSIQGIKDAATTSTSAIAKVASAVTKAVLILQVIQLAWQMINAISKLFQGDDEAKYQQRISELKEHVDALDYSYQRLKQEMDDAFGTEAIDKYIESVDKLNDTSSTQLQMIREQVGHSVKGGLFGIGGHHSLGSNIKKKAGFTASDWATIQEWMRANGIIGRAQDWESWLFTLTPEQMRDFLTSNAGIVFSSKAGAVTSNSGYNGSDMVSDLQKYADNAKEAEDITDQLAEKLNGVTFDALKDEFKDLVQTATTSLNDINNSFDKFMREATYNRVRSAYDKQLEKYYDDLTELQEKYNKGELTEEQYRAEIARKRKEYQNTVNAARNDYERSLTDTGVNYEDTEQGATSGGFESMSEDTGTELNGRFAAMQAQLVAMTDEAVKSNGVLATALGINDEIRTIQNQSYLELQSISENTRRLVEPVLQMQTELRKVRENTETL